METNESNSFLPIIPGIAVNIGIPDRNFKFKALRANEKRLIVNYAASLVRWIRMDMKSAIMESSRWHLKLRLGLMEPMQCPHRPDIEVIKTETGVFYDLSNCGIFKNKQK